MQKELEEAKYTSKNKDQSINKIKAELDKADELNKSYQFKLEAEKEARSMLI